MEAPVIVGLLEHVADVFCADHYQQLKEIGIFLQAAPEDVSQAGRQAVCWVDGRFGLASWCLNPLYVEARRRLKRDKADMRAATVILVVNPDYLSAWNLRKEHMRRDKLSAEFIFSELILSRNPKSAETWAHRAWLLRNYGSDSAQLKRELELAWRASSCVPHNYYAGAHRLRLLSRMSRQLLLEELTKSRKWLQSHVGDSSGWWYYRALLDRLGWLDGTSAESVENEWFFGMWTRYGEKYQNISMFRKFSFGLDMGKLEGDTNLS